MNTPISPAPTQEEEEVGASAASAIDASVSSLTDDLCEDCPPVGYPTDKTRCLPCPRRDADNTPHGYDAGAPDTCKRCGNRRDHPVHAEISVSDIPDAELLGRAVRGCRARQSGKFPRWVGVSDTFVLGSTFSKQLCRRFGLDPYEMVGRKP